MRTRRTLLVVVAVVYIGGLVGLAFVPGSIMNRSSWLAQVVLFIPVGVLLALLMGRRRWWAAVVFATLGGAWLEAGQSVWMPVGYANLMDLFWVTFGAVLGVGFVGVAGVMRHESMPTHESPSMVAQSGPKEIPQD
jgi:hypothetical protein